MATIRALTTMPMDSGITEDAVTNTWHFTTTDPVNGIDLDAIATALQNWYLAVDTYMSPKFTGAGLVKFYDLADLEPRPPIQENAIAFVPSTSDGLPSELAICMSFQGARVAGQAQARRRGRVYLGPLSLNILGGSAASDRPSSTAVTAIAAAGDALLAASDAASSWSWVVYSPTNDNTVTVTNGWVDNAFDVQRRRGLDATSRTTFS